MGVQALVIAMQLCVLEQEIETHPIGLAALPGELDAIADPAPVVGCAAERRGAVLGLVGLRARVLGLLVEVDLAVGRGRRVRERRRREPRRRLLHARGQEKAPAGERAARRPQE